LKWRVYDDSDDFLTQVRPKKAELPLIPEKSRSAQPKLAGDEPDPAREKLKQSLQWEYPFQAATREPAKTSVSALRRRLPAETEEEAQRAKFVVNQSSFARHNPVPGALSAVEIGTAHHQFLQFFDFTKPAEPHLFLVEAARLEEAGVLSAAARKALDIPALCAFWNSEIGQRIRAQAGNVHRELEFTARFSPKDLRAIELYPNATVMSEEFVVVQGVVDLAVILPEEIWVLDFKTDHMNATEFAEKTHNYQRQLRLYACALRHIYGRPVTRSWLHFLSSRQSVSLQLEKD